MIPPWGIGSTSAVSALYANGSDALPGGSSPQPAPRPRTPPPRGSSCRMAVRGPVVLVGPVRGETKHVERSPINGALPATKKDWVIPPKPTPWASADVWPPHRRRPARDPTPTAWWTGNRSKRGSIERSYTTQAGPLGVVKHQHKASLCDPQGIGLGNTRLAMGFKRGSICHPIAPAGDAILTRTLFPAKTSKA